MILARLLAQHEKLSNSDRTIEAENGLDIGENSYWFISRVDHLYGRVLMVWDVDDQSPAVGTVNTFDTGGLWADYLIGDPPFRGSIDKRNFVRRNAISVRDTGGLFASWVSAAFLIEHEYVAGVGAPTLLMEDRLLPNSDNAFSWSWEIRCLKSAAGIPNMFAARRVFWTSEEYVEFLSFIRANVQDSAAYYAILALVKSTADVSPTLGHARQRARAFEADRLSSLVAIK